MISGTGRPQENRIFRFLKIHLKKSLFIQIEKKFSPKFIAWNLGLDGETKVWRNGHFNNNNKNNNNNNNNDNDNDNDNNNDNDNDNDNDNENDKNYYPRRHHHRLHH